MRHQFRIRVVENKGLEYRDDGGVCRFNLESRGNVWRRTFPGIRWDEDGRHAMTPEEQARLKPRVISHLENRRLFGIIPERSTVEIVEPQ
jgi:hypothetical protein